MLTDKSNNVEDLYHKYMSFTNLMLEEHDLLEVAAIMVIQGLTYYRTALGDEDYQKMIKNIYDRRDDVKTLEV